jgi:signal transduction histidine kinase
VISTPLSSIWGCLIVPDWTRSERSQVPPSRTPVIIVSGLDDTHLAQEAVTLGAQDYVVKDGVTPKDLARAITYAIARQRVLDDLERARHAQLEAKDRFLSHVSHELRTPLAAVYQFVSLVADETVGPLESEQRDCLAVATRNIRQLTRMIDDLLNVGRVTASGWHSEPSACASPSWSTSAYSPFGRAPKRRASRFLSRPSLSLTRGAIPVAQHRFSTTSWITP